MYPGNSFQILESKMKSSHVMTLYYVFGWNAATHDQEQRSIRRSHLAMVWPFSWIFITESCAGNLQAAAEITQSNMRHKCNKLTVADNAQANDNMSSVVTNGTSEVPCPDVRIPSFTTLLTTSTTSAPPTGEPGNTGATGAPVSEILWISDILTTIKSEHLRVIFRKKNWPDMHGYVIIIITRTVINNKDALCRCMHRYRLKYISMVVCGNKSE